MIKRTKKRVFLFLFFRSLFRLGASFRREKTNGVDNFFIYQARTLDSVRLSRIIKKEVVGKKCCV